MRASQWSSTWATILVLGLMQIAVCGTAIASPGWTIGRLTNNNTDDWCPRISGMNVVWQSWDGSDNEIYSNAL